MRRATSWFIFGTVLLDMLALGIIAPVLPTLVIQLEGGNEASAAGLFGVFGTVWAAMQFLFAPVLGSLSDRVGRRPVILVSCLGLGLDYAVMALAPTVVVVRQEVTSSPPVPLSVPPSPPVPLSATERGD